MGQYIISHPPSGERMINIDIRNDTDCSDFIRCDLTDRAMLARIVSSLDRGEEYRIIHLAGLFEKDMSKRGMHTPEDFHRMNVTATENIFSVLGSSGLDIKSVVFSSAALVNCLSKTDDPYATSKLEAEKIIEKWNADSVQIMRITRIVGGYYRGSVPMDIISDFMKKLLSERNIVINGSDTERDYVYLSDVRDMLLMQDNGFHVKNIYSSSQISIGDIMETVNNAMHDNGLINENREIRLNPDTSGALGRIEGKSDVSSRLRYRTSLQAVTAAIDDYVKGLHKGLGFVQ